MKKVTTARSRAKVTTKTTKPAEQPIPTTVKIDRVELMQLLASTDCMDCLDEPIAGVTLGTLAAEMVDLRDQLKEIGDAMESRSPLRRLVAAACRDLDHMQRRAGIASEMARDGVR